VPPLSLSHLHSGEFYQLKSCTFLRRIEVRPLASGHFERAHHTRLPITAMLRTSGRDTQPLLGV
jgi:hypothetical protein